MNTPQEWAIRKAKRTVAWLQFERMRLIYFGNLFGPSINLGAYDPHRFPISAAYDAIKWYSKHLPKDDIFFNGKHIAELSVVVMQALMGAAIYHPWDYGGARNFELISLKGYFRDERGEREFITACKVSHAAAKVAYHPNMRLQSCFGKNAPEALGACVWIKIKHDIGCEHKSLDNMIEEHVQQYFPDKSDGNDEFMRSHMAQILAETASEEGKYVNLNLQLNHTPKPV